MSNRVESRIKYKVSVQLWNDLIHNYRWRTFTKWEWLKVIPFASFRTPTYCLPHLIKLASFKFQDRLSTTNRVARMVIDQIKFEHGI